MRTRPGRMSKSDCGGATGGGDPGVVGAGGADGGVASEGGAGAAAGAGVGLTDGATTPAPGTPGSAAGPVGA